MALQIIVDVDGRDIDELWDQMTGLLCGLDHAAGSSPCRVEDMGACITDSVEKAADWLWLYREGGDA